MEQAALLTTALKMLVALGAVLLTFGAALFLAKKFSGVSPSFMKKMGSRKEKPMEVLGFQSLGPGRGLYLVRCLDKRILIGATSHSINQIVEMTEAEAEEQADAFGSTLKEKMSDDESLQAMPRVKGEFREVARV